jgi:hypothetical protein
VTLLSTTVRAAVAADCSWPSRLSAGLGAALDALAADPVLARLLLVESRASLHPARPDYERALARLARVLADQSRDGGGRAITPELADLLAAGVASHLAGRVLAGEADRLPESRSLLLEYLLAPARLAAPRPPSCAGCA